MNQKYVRELVHNQELKFEIQNFAENQECQENLHLRRSKIYQNKDQRHSILPSIYSMQLLNKTPSMGGEQSTNIATLQAIGTKVPTNRQVDPPNHFVVGQMKTCLQFLGERTWFCKISWKFLNLWENGSFHPRHNWDPAETSMQCQQEVSTELNSAKPWVGSDQQTLQHCKHSAQQLNKKMGPANHEHNFWEAEPNLQNSSVVFSLR